MDVEIEDIHTLKCYNNYEECLTKIRVSNSGDNPLTMQTLTIIHLSPNFNNKLLSETNSKFQKITINTINPNFSP